MYLQIKSLYYKANDSLEIFFIVVHTTKADVVNSSKCVIYLLNLTEYIYEEQSEVATQPAWSLKIE